MYDAKPDVLNVLETIPNVTVSGDFPAKGAKMPHISFYELANAELYTASDTVGLLTEVAIQIDVWHNNSTGALAKQVNEKMNSIGFRRQFAGDLNDPSGLNRKTMRYRGVVDIRNMRVHQ